MIFDLRHLSSGSSKTFQKAPKVLGFERPGWVVFAPEEGQGRAILMSRADLTQASVPLGILGVWWPPHLIHTPAVQMEEKLIYSSSGRVRRTLEGTIYTKQCD